MIQVASEIEVLRKVLVHEPGHEWDLIPAGLDIAKKFLTEDLLHLERARKEHRVFRRVLGQFLGDENVLELETLLVDVCGEQRNRDELLGAVAGLETLGFEICKRLEQLSAERFVAALIHGAIIKPGEKSTYQNLFRPLPNLLFTRDLGAVVTDGFVVGQAAKEARLREMLLMRFALRHHVFEGAPLLDIRDLATDAFWSEMGGLPRASIEGGDILVLDDATVMIGTGERTSETAFLGLVWLLKKHCPTIKQIVRAELPKARESMHLDTVLTCTNKNEFVLYRSILDETPFTIFRWPFRATGAEKCSTFENLMTSIDWDSPKTIQCGHEVQLFQTREQWTDAANVLAVRPGVVIGYRRNKETAKAFEEAGYEILDAENDETKVAECAEEARNPGLGSRRVLIGIPGAELSRARGGPRCMSLPLERDPL